MHRVLWGSWLLCLLLTWPAACTSLKGLDAPCQPQGILRLDQPYPAPHRVSLPFCAKYQCSCCNASHALAVQRSLRAVVLDDDLSLGCKAQLISLGCRICDPLVGVGLKTAVCLSVCQDLLAACAQDYFTFDGHTGLIAPCSDGDSSSSGSSSGGSLVCSQLQDMVAGPAELCRAAGLKATAESSAELCFDGSPAAAEACPAVSSRSGSSGRSPRDSSRSSTDSSSADSSTARQRRKGRQQQQQQSKALSWLTPWKWKMKMRQKRQLAAAADVVLAGLVSAGMALAVVLLLQRLMKAAAPQGRQRRQPEVRTVRDMLAKAAEARRAGDAGADASSGSAVTKKSGKRI